MNEVCRFEGDDCPDCTAAAQVSEWMTEFAKVDERVHPLPDPAVLWLQAKLLRSSADVQRASRPITVLQIGAYAFIAACWAALLTWKWAALEAWVTTFTPNNVLLGTSGPNTAPASATILLVVVMLMTATVGIAMHTILAEE